MVSHQQAVFLRSWDLATSALRVLYTCVSPSDPSIFLRSMHGVVIVTSSYLFGHAMSCSFSKNLHATLLALLSLLQHLQSGRGKLIPHTISILRTGFLSRYQFTMGYPWWHRLPRNCHGNWAVVKTTHAAPGGRNPTIQSQKKWARMVKTWNDMKWAYLYWIQVRGSTATNSTSHSAKAKSKISCEKLHFFVTAETCNAEGGPHPIRSNYNNSTGTVGDDLPSSMFRSSSYITAPNAIITLNYIESYWIDYRWIVSWSNKSPFISTSVHLAAALV